MHRRIVLGAAALACTLLLPAAAHAGTPFVIGQGVTPNVYTEAGNGTAHVIWQNTADGISYCQIPRGATACTNFEDLGDTPGAGYSGETFLVRLSATNIDAVMPVYASGRTWRKRSTDNGLTWSASWTEIYGQIGNMGSPAAQPFVWNGGAGDEYIFSTGSSLAFGARVDGSDAAINDNADFDTGGYTSNLGIDSAAVALADGNDALLVGNDASNAFFRRLTLNNPSIESNWSAETQVAGPLSVTRVATGPAGTFLFGSGVGVGGGRPEIRRFNEVTDTFDAPVTLDPDTAYINGVTVGPGGVAAIWRKNDSTSPGNRMQFSFSASGAPGTYATRTISRGEEVMNGMNVSLAADNLGWVAYEGSGNGANYQIKLVDTTVAPEPPAPPSTNTGGTGTTTPVTPIKPVTPKTPSAVKKTTVSSNGADITFGVPRTCIPSGQPFTVTLSWKKQKRKGNKFVKITRTDFYIGSKRQKIDKKAPFKQTLKIPSPKKGQTYTLKARAFIKMSKGKKVPKKSVTSTLKVCS